MDEYFIFRPREERKETKKKRGRERERKRGGDRTRGVLNYEYFIGGNHFREQFHDSSPIRRSELSVVGFYSPFLPFPFPPPLPLPLPSLPRQLCSRVFQSRARKMAGPFRRRISRNYRRATRKFIKARCACIEYPAPDVSCKSEFTSTKAK